MTADDDAVAAERQAELRASLEELGIRPPRRSRSRAIAVLGLGTMTAAAVLLVYGYSVVQATDNPLDQRDGLALTIGGVGAAVLGGTLFLYGALTEFLRFWMVRLGHHLDRRPPPREQPSSDS